MFIHVGVLWKQNGRKLQNKVRDWQYSERDWILPSEDKIDFIELITGDTDFTENDEECSTKCGTEGLYNNRNWCWKVSESWDYCFIGKYYKTPSGTGLIYFIVHDFDKSFQQFSIS